MSHKCNWEGMKIIAQGGMGEGEVGEAEEEGKGGEAEEKEAGRKGQAGKAESAVLF